MLNELMKKDGANKTSIYLRGVIIGVAVCLLVMLLFSAILLFFNIDRAYAALFATISVAVGCYIASLYTAKQIGNKGFVTGAIIGAAVFLLITVLSLIIGNGLSLNTLFHFIIMMLSSVIGGIIGVNKQKHKKYI